MFKRIFIILIAAFIFAQYVGVSHGASSDSGSSENYLDQYKQAKKFVERAKKLEEKDKNDRATKLYVKALDKLQEAYKADRNNPDILNYLGFTTRKLGDYENGEKYYLQGLQIDPNHKGINEYLGELYVNTNRMDLAKERLAVLKSCNCEEYSELKEIIEKK